MSNANAWRTLDGAPPLVIAHRGASGYRPEHTLESYALAIELGADYIEPDLVATKDGHLIARHEPLLDDTTDVKSHAKFADRRSTKILDGRSVTGWFASDFTLAEIRELRAVQPNPARSQSHNGRYVIPTFAEILELVVAESRKRGRRIGVYPETKHPAFHLALGLPLEERLLATLKKYELDGPDAPIYIQSFESANLQYLRARTKLPLVQLLDDQALVYDATGSKIIGVEIRTYDDPRGGASPKTLEDIARYAQAIGPWKRQILRDAGSGSLVATTLIEQAHVAGLKVHAYTFRNEPATLAAEYAGDPVKEYHAYFALGIDGVFTDFTDTALEARASFARR